MIRHVVPHRHPYDDGKRLWLALTGLTGLAVCQPILELFGKQASFFIAHDVDRLDLVLFTVSLSLALPAILVGLIAAVGALGTRVRDAACRLCFTALSALWVLAALRAVGDPLPGPLALVVAAVLGLASDRAWRRSRPFGDILALLAGIIPVAVALFVWHTAIAGLWDAPWDGPVELEKPSRSSSLAQPPPAAERPAPHPIVWLVFDELPLVSLLDENAEIDAELYPSFAALAATSSWFRNASTVWSHTEKSIVSMLSGQIADPGRAATRSQYPENLLSWLQTSHSVHASEPVTRLGPRSDSVPRPAGLPRRKRLLALGYDVALVYAHRILPPDYAADLPPVDGQWGHFGASRATKQAATSWSYALQDLRGEHFASFLEDLEPENPPPFFFEHVMLPHLPSRFLPSRRVHGGRPVYRPAAKAWLNDEQYAVEVYKRHLLQVGFVDRLVGDLLARLRETGLLDATLLIVTSDHGASYWPAQDRRMPGATAHPDDILRIPLFIKAPGQTIGTVRDDNVQTIDLAATIADFLDADLPWPTAGRSARDPGTPRPPVKTLCGPDAGCQSMDATFAPDPASLRRKLSLFDPGRGEDRWASQGTYRHLVGRPVSDFPIAPTRSCRAELDQLQPLLAHDPASFFAPAAWTGALHCRPALAAGTHLALATRGQLRATTALREVKGEVLFSALFSDRLLVAGDNAPALFVIENGPDSVALAPVSELVSATKSTPP